MRRAQIVCLNQKALFLLIFLFQDQGILPRVSMTETKLLTVHNLQIGYV